MKDDILSEEIQEEQRVLQKIEKEKRIKKEVNRLKKLHKNMPKNTMDKASSLINNAAFMTITLEDLQNTINYEGTVGEYKNGENQFGTKESPETKIYNTMIKNHMGIMRQLTDLDPEEPKQKPIENDPLFNIINRGKNG